MSNLIEVYSDTLCRLAYENKRIVLIDCDLSKSFRSQRFQQQFPDRYYNVGIAEQNAISIAAGLAAKGLYPVVQMFACFASTRCCDQIRNSLAINDLPVLIVGGKPGITDGQGGVTHQAIEDYGIISSIPNISIFSPINSMQIHLAFQKLLSGAGPCYLRLFDIESYDPILKYPTSEWFSIFSGTTFSIITTGDQFQNCCTAIEELNKYNINASLIYINMLKPLPSDSRLLSLLQNQTDILVVETHNEINGLGSHIIQKYRKQIAANIESLAIRDHFAESGTYAELCSSLHIDADAITQVAIQLLFTKEKK